MRDRMLNEPFQPARDLLTRAGLDGNHARRSPRLLAADGRFVRNSFCALLIKTAQKELRESGQKADYFASFFWSF
jgi:hypothetical protein